MSTPHTQWPSEIGNYAAVYPEGLKDEYGYPYFLPIGEFEAVNVTDLIVGHAGFGGIEFRLRCHSPGVWAYYPIDDDYRLLGRELAEVAVGWKNGTVTV